MKNSDKPIHPVQEWVEINPHADGLVWKGGLTKREYFAGLALQGFISGRKDLIQRISEEALHKFASMAVLSADILLQKLEE